MHNNTSDQQQSTAYKYNKFIQYMKNKKSEHEITDPIVIAALERLSVMVFKLHICTCTFVCPHLLNLSFTEKFKPKSKKKEEPSSLFQRHRVDTLLLDLRSKFPPKYYQVTEAQVPVG